MQTAPRGVVKTEHRPTASAEAAARWAGQEPSNWLRALQRRRRIRIIDVQLSSVFTAGLIAALTLPSWWGPALMIAGWIVPALAGAWLDTYRPIGGRRPANRTDFAIAIARLDQGVTE